MVTRRGYNKCTDPPKAVGLREIFVRAPIVIGSSLNVGPISRHLPFTIKSSTEKADVEVSMAHGRGNVDVQVAELLVGSRLVALAWRNGLGKGGILLSRAHELSTTQF